MQWGKWYKTSSQWSLPTMVYHLQEQKQVSVSHQGEKNQETIPMSCVTDVRNWDISPMNFPPPKHLKFYLKFDLEWCCKWGLQWWQWSWILMPSKNGIVELTSSAWILLDKQSTVDVFYNPELLSDIWPSSTKLKPLEDKSNSMASRTMGAIALELTENSQGGFYFYSLATGKFLNFYSWNELFIPVDWWNQRKKVPVWIQLWLCCCQL